MKESCRSAARLTGTTQVKFKRYSMHRDDLFNIIKGVISTCSFKSRVPGDERLVV